MKKIKTKECVIKCRKKRKQKKFYNLFQCIKILRYNIYISFLRIF